VRIGLLGRLRATNHSLYIGRRQRGRVRKNLCPSSWQCDLGRLSGGERLRADGLVQAIPLTLLVNSLLGDVSSLLLRNSVALTLARSRTWGRAQQRHPIGAMAHLVFLKTPSRVRKEHLCEGSGHHAHILSHLSPVCLNAVLIQGRSQLLYPVFAAFAVMVCCSNKPGRHDRQATGVGGLDVRDGSLRARLR